jgi:predicted N-acetyltransferase YhbS
LVERETRGRLQDINVTHLLQHPEHRRTVAQWIHEQWWADKPGHTVDSMAARLATASDPDTIPLSLLALRDDTPIGTVNLVENDNDERPDLSPWLAALLVLPEHRGQGVGSQLVRSVIAEAARLGIPQVFLGTDSPQCYARLGATMHEEGADGCLTSGGCRSSSSRSSIE